MRDRVQYNAGVPRWFTYAFHLWSKRRCQRIGHTRTAWPSTCGHCGEILPRPTKGPLGNES